MSHAENESYFDEEPQASITPIEADDPACWRERAIRAREKAFNASTSEASAFRQEATDYERLAVCAAAVLIASEAA